MAFTFIQTNTQVTTNTTNVLTLSSASTVGNLVVVTIRQLNYTTVTCDSITDSAGNTYIKAGQSLLTVSEVIVEQWYGVQVTGGATTITATFSASVNNRITADEFNGGMPTNALIYDKSQFRNGASGTSGSFLTGSSRLLPANAGQLVVASYAFNSSISAPIAGTDYTLASSSSAFLVTQYRLSATTAETAPLSWTTSRTYGLIGATYIPIDEDTLYPPLIASSVTLYSPLVDLASSIITLSTDLISFSFDPAVDTLLPPFIASTSVLFTPTITTGAISIAPPLLTNNNIIYSPSITTGAVAITVPYINSTEALYEPLVTTGELVLVVPFIASTNVLYGSTITTGQVIIQTPFISSAINLYPPTISTGAVSLDLPFISSTSNTYEPSISAQAVDLAMAFISANNELYLPTLTVGSVTIIAPAIQSNNVLYLPTITTEAAIIILPFIASLSELYEPTLILLSNFGEPSADKAAYLTAEETTLQLTTQANTVQFSDNIDSIALDNSKARY